MTGIEDVVRRALHEQVLRQPPMTEPAARAIAGAAAVRRRHTVLAVGAAVVALVAAVSGGVALHDTGTGPGLPPSTGAPVPASPSLSPTVAPSLPAVGLSALVENNSYLLTPRGELLWLSKMEAQPGRAYQTADGWLVNSLATGPADPTGKLWLFRPDGSAHKLLDGVDGDGVVSSDGRRLAWLGGGKLNLGHLDDSGALVTDATSPAPERGYPLAIAGSAVLLGYTATGGGIDNFDVWVPQRGRYTAAWDKAQSNGIVGVFGATADGRWLIGNVLASPGSGGKGTCLGRLDPMDSLRVVARACGLPEAHEWGTVSPDGHWLAYQSNDAASRVQITVLDLTTVFQQPKVAVTWQPEAAGIWVGPDTMVGQGPDERFYRYRVGQPAGEEIAVTGMPPGGKVFLVPKLS